MAGERPTAAMVLSIIGGVLVFLNASLLAVFATVIVIVEPAPFPVDGQTIDIGAPLVALAAFGVILGMLIVVFGILMFVKPGSAKALGVVVLILSVASILLGGGFFIGLVLGLIGGILGIVFKPTPTAPFPAAPPTQPPTPPQ